MVVVFRDRSSPFVMLIAATASVADNIDPRTKATGSYAADCTAGFIMPKANL